MIKTQVTIDQLPSEVADALRMRLGPNPNVLASDKSVNQWLQSVNSSFVFREYCEFHGLSGRSSMLEYVLHGIEAAFEGSANARKQYL